MVSIESHIQMQIAEFSAGLNKTSIKNYMILDTAGNQLVPGRGYNLDIDQFVQFLQTGVERFHAEK